MSQVPLKKKENQLTVVEDVHMYRRQMRRHGRRASSRHAVRAVRG